MQLRHRITKGVRSKGCHKSHKKSGVNDINDSFTSEGCQEVYRIKDAQEAFRSEGCQGNLQEWRMLKKSEGWQESLQGWRMSKKSAGLEYDEEVFTSEGCEESLQEWRMSKRCAGMKDVKKIFRNEEWQGSLQEWKLSGKSSSVNDVKMLRNDGCQWCKQISKKVLEDVKGCQRSGRKPCYASLMALLKHVIIVQIVLNPSFT